MGSGSGSDEQLQTQVERLKEQLAEEQALRRQAEAAAEQAAATCSRLQKARDELAAALLAAERRAAEAEEEQLAAEAAAAALEQALREQQVAAEAGPGPSPQPAAPLSPGSERGPRRGAATSDADLEILLAELDQERQRSEELVRTLEAAEREAVAATEKLLRAQQRIKQLEGGGKRGLFGGVRKSASAAALPPGGGGEPADGEEGAAALQQRIAALKASRDKLIAAFDAQAAEVERLSGDNAALAQSLMQLRDAAAKWEAQAQGSLAQNERLKDLLEESATWGLPPAAASADARAAAAQAGPGGEATAAAAAAGDPAALAALCQRFERALLLEKARSAQLDLHVRALAAELTRAAQSRSDAQTALLPVLGGVEARLVQVLGMRPRAAALQAAAG